MAAIRQLIVWAIVSLLIPGAVPRLAASPIPELIDGSADFVYLTGGQDFSKGAMESDTEIYIHLEKSYYTTQSDIDVDLLVDSPSDAQQYSLDPGNEILAAGAYVHVYLLHMDVINTTRHIDAGSITFDEPIVALISSKQHLDDTDASLGDSSSTYTPTPDARRFWDKDNGNDMLTVSSDLRTLTIDSIKVGTKKNYADQIRILVQVPEPSAAVLLLLAGSALLAFRPPFRSRRRSSETGIFTPPGA